MQQCYVSVGTSELQLAILKVSQSVVEGFEEVLRWCLLALQSFAPLKASCRACTSPLCNVYLVNHPKNTPFQLYAPISGWVLMSSTVASREFCALKERSHAFISFRTVVASMSERCVDGSNVRYRFWLWSGPGRVCLLPVPWRGHVEQDAYASE